MDGRTIVSLIFFLVGATRRYVFWAHKASSYLTRFVVVALDVFLFGCCYLHIHFLVFVIGFCVSAILAGLPSPVVFCVHRCLLRSNGETC